MRRLAVVVSAAALYTCQTRTHSQSQIYPAGPASDPSQAFWHLGQRCESGPLPSMSRFVVIGTGLSGASAAYHLAKDYGTDTIVLDARGVSEGATGRNGGFVQPIPFGLLVSSLIKSPPSNLAELRSSIESFRFERAGRQAIRDYCTEHGIEGAVDLDKDIDVLQVFDSQDELKKRVGTVLWPFRSLAPIVGIDVIETRAMLEQKIGSMNPESPWQCALLVSKGADTIWAAKFAAHVLGSAASYGAKVFTHTRVLEVVEGPTGATIRTDRGEIQCSKVILATNAYTGNLLPEFRERIRPIRNHVAVTGPVPLLGSSSGHRLGLSAEDGFVYMMQRKDGRLVLGGFRNQEKDFGVDQADDSSTATVRTVSDFMRDFLPSRFVFSDNTPITLQHTWTGIIGWSADDHPWVGPVPNSKSVLVCAGFSGHGMTQTFLSGAAVAAIAAGRAPATFVQRYIPSWDRKFSANLSAGHTDTHD